MHLLLAAQGFMTMSPSGYPAPIGKERVDRTFKADVDTGNLQLVLGASDPRYSRVFWAYKSGNGAAGLFDKLLCYDYALDRWSPIALSGEYLGSLSQPGLTLENLDSISSSIDLLGPSLDSFATSVTPRSPCREPCAHFLRAPTSVATIATRRRRSRAGACSCAASGYRRRIGFRLGRHAGTADRHRNLHRRERHGCDRPFAARIDARAAASAFRPAPAGVALGVEPGALRRPMTFVLPPAFRSANTASGFARTALRSTPARFGATTGAGPARLGFDGSASRQTPIADHFAQIAAESTEKILKRIHDYRAATRSVAPAGTR
jgi:hypothetical protein